MTRQRDGERIHQVLHDFESLAPEHGELKALACSMFATGLWPTLGMAIRDAREILRIGKVKPESRQ